LLGSRTQDLPCGHSFHEMCVFDLRRFTPSGRGLCPNCRRACSDLVPVEELLETALRNFVLEDFEGCARKCLEILSIAEGHPQASALLGDLHLTGRGLPSNLDLAFEYARVAHAAGIPVGRLTMAQIWLRDDFAGKSERFAQQLVRQLCRQGSIEAIAMHAHMSYHGLGVPEDDELAYNLARFAHEAGDSTGTAVLAQMYVDENTPEHDPTKAFQLATQLHHQQDPRGAYILAQIYLDGLGGDQDSVLGVQLARQAMEAGLQEAAELLVPAQAT